jgi:hypothetical protein
MALERTRNSDRRLLSYSLSIETSAVLVSNGDLKMTVSPHMIRRSQR